jgi:hypothetical protein
VSALSQRLCLRHHSTAELVDRLVEHGGWHAGTASRIVVKYL